MEGSYFQVLLLGSEGLPFLPSSIAAGSCSQHMSDNFWSSWPKVVQAPIGGLGLRARPYRTWHRKVPFVGIKACYFMRILLLMVSDYCSKGWIFVPTSGKPGKSRAWGWSKSWTNVKLRDYFTSQILYDPKCWTVARTMNGSTVQYFGSWLNCYMI